jgi:hypothetical protein
MICKLDLAEDFYIFLLVSDMKTEARSLSDRSCNHSVTCGFIVFFLVVTGVFHLMHVVFLQPASIILCSFTNISYVYFVRFSCTAISVATGYEMDDRGVEVQVPIRLRVFFSPQRPDWF